MTDRLASLIGGPGTARRGVVIAGGVMAAWLAVTALVRDPLAARVASRDPVPLLGMPLPSFAPASPEELVTRVLVVLGVLVAIGAGAAARWPGGLRRFFLTPGAATDLAVLRIAVFGLLLVLPRVPEAVRLSGFPEDLRVPPRGMPWLLDVVPTSPQTVRPLAVVFLVACACAVLGLWTRPATIVAAVVGLYLLGVPQYYGKVSHYHHVWWAAALLAAAPCGDALSVDALRRGWRRPGSIPPRDRTGVRYALPIRLLWLLMAGAYLFPGLWKVASAGWEWVFSDNLRYVMYEHWGRLEGFAPPGFPVDQTPLTEAAALATVGFELGFVVLLFSPLLRPWLAASGLVFHNASFVVLRLGFFTLQVLYVSFVPWQRLARAAGRRLQPLEVSVAHDANRARRIVAAADAGDPFGATILTVRDDGPPLTLDGDRTGHPDADHPGRVLRRVLARSPLLWPLVPLTWLASRRRPHAWLDAWLTGGRPLGPPSPRNTDRQLATVAATTVVGGTLITGMVVMGLFGVTAAWPVATYPTFAGIRAATIDRLSIEVAAEDGTTRLLASEQLRGVVSWEKYDGLARPILRAGDDPPLARVRSLLDVLAIEGVDLDSAAHVTLLRDTEQLTRDGAVVVGREAMATVAVADLDPDPPAP